MDLFTTLSLFAIMCLVKAEYDHHSEHPVGYSFAKFSGPVSGPSREVISHDEHHGHSVDYVSKPDYQFEYGVEDPKSKVSQFRKENRQDDTVIGEYSYTDPFGHVRTVKYTADKIHGFRAQIYIDGKLETPHVPQAPTYQEHHEAVKEDSSQYSESGEYASSEDY